MLQFILSVSTIVSHCVAYLHMCPAGHFLWFLQDRRSRNFPLYSGTPLPPNIPESHSELLQHTHSRLKYSEFFVMIILEHGRLLQTGMYIFRSM